MAPRRGRKPAKNENAAALINALTFVGGSLKAPPAGTPTHYQHVFLNQGLAIGYNGIVAAAHPIPEGIAGYPHLKLFKDALENTDKTFSLTYDDGHFTVGSDKYTAIVPTVDPSNVVPTFPDQIQARYPDYKGFIDGLKAALRVSSESGTIAAYSAIRFDGSTMMATNGTVIVQVGCVVALPPVIIPTQFATALVKWADKEIDGIGVDMNTMGTFTVWYKDGSWLRTNCYPADTYSLDMLNKFFGLMEAGSGVPATAIDLKVWRTINTLLPFTDDANRVLVRRGVVRTHADRSAGASLEVPESELEFDTDGDNYAKIGDMITSGAMITTANGTPVLYFTGAIPDTAQPVRGVLMCFEPEEEYTTDSGAGWGTGTQETAPEEPASGGWAIAANIAPPPEEKAAPVQRVAEPQGEWKGGPTEGMADDPEFLSQRYDLPVEDFIPDLTNIPDFPPNDQGVDLGGDWGTAIQEGFKPSGWLNTLTDDDAGIKG